MDQSADLLFPELYDELRSLARAFLRNEGRVHSLDPTALVHEAYIRMIRLNRITWNDRDHFLAMAARQMRRILVEHARAAGARKRGARPTRVTLDEEMLVADDRTVEILDLEDALEKLASRRRRQAEVSEMRLFAGARFKEIASALGISERTAREDWKLARAKLMRSLRSDG